MKRNGHVFELVTIEFADELNVWNERIKDDFFWGVSTFGACWCHLLRWERLGKEQIGRC